MPALSLQVRDEGNLKVIRDALEILRSGGDGALKPYFRRAAARYLAFIRRRFVDASRGNGTWPDLALSTKIRRLRKQYRGHRFAVLLSATGGKSHGERLAALAAGAKFAILRDTSTLFGSLTEGSPGNVFGYAKDGVTVGTRVFYAAYHQDPSRPGHPPRRLIFVQPDADTETQMAVELANGIVAAFGEQEAGSGGAT